MSKQEFEVELFKDEDSSGVGFVVPFDVQAVFGKKSQVKVRGTVDGVQFRGSIAPYGGKHYMGVKREIREAIAKGGGDTVFVVMEIDDEPRVVEVPQDLQQALETNAQAKQVFDKFSYSHQKEYVEWITSAKKPETRASRVEQMLEQLTAGKK